MKVMWGKLALLIAVVACLISHAEAWCKQPHKTLKTLKKEVALSSLALLSFGTPLNAQAVDCYKDCSRNCLKVAPGSADYCKESCTEYCAQDDRTDGLSGSISNTGGETGIFGGSPIEGGNSVTRESDRPPVLPKLIPDSLLKIPKIKST